MEFPWRCNVDTIAMDLKVSWEMSAESSAKQLREEIENITVESEASEVVSIGADGDGITLELDSNAFFRPGSAQLKEESAPYLRNLSKELAAPLYKFFNVTVEGHTDDDPISSIQFPSNWELSTARASAVVRFFNAEGMDESRLKASGFAHTRPKVPNRDPETKEPIPANQAQNRRVIVRINRTTLFKPIQIPKFRRKGGDRRNQAPRRTSQTN